MAKKNNVKTYSYLEQWDTRFGKSERVVIRKAGKFVDNISLTALKKAPAISR